MSEFNPFASFLDTIHRGGDAFSIGLGREGRGEKIPGGFWQGATENPERGKELLSDMEGRGLVIARKVLWIPDGGKGIRKALREKFGKKLLHQRGTLHQDRNRQRHLAKRYRKAAHRRFRTALEQTRYEDARQLLMEMEKWLRGIHESAADSCMEAREKRLTLHRLKGPALLRKSLHSTNPIESMFSLVRQAEGNIKRDRGSKMMQRGLASVLLYCEKRFRRVNGSALLPEVIRNREAAAETTAATILGA